MQIVYQGALRVERSNFDPGCLHKLEIMQRLGFGKPHQYYDCALHGQGCGSLYWILTGVYTEIVKRKGRLDKEEIADPAVHELQRGFTERPKKERGSSGMG